MHNNVILFYEQDNDLGCFSNWYKCHFTFAGKSYTSGEQYMMYQKAILFQDYEIAELILKENNPSKIKKLGRQVKHFDSNIWNSVCQQIMRRGLRAKFSQNYDLMCTLLKTKGYILAEASPKDRIWGIGLGRNNPDALEPLKWKGKNLLGKTLMKVREDLIFWLDNTSNSFIKYIDFSVFPNIWVWNYQIKYIYEFESLKDTLNVFINSYSKSFINDVFFDKTLAEVEKEILAGDYLMYDGFWELKQDIYEMYSYNMINRYETDFHINEIYFFSKYWLEIFNQKDIDETNLEISFQKDMEKLHFDMDGGSSARIKYPKLDILNSISDLYLVLFEEYDINLLTSLLISKYRYITHWTQQSLLDNNNKEWFILVLTQLMHICC